MRRFLVFTCCLIVFGAGAARAAEEGHAPAEPGKPNPYVVNLHGPAGIIEEKFDLAKPADRVRLYESLEQGHVHELKKDEPPDLFAPKRWDLGVWSIIVFAVLFLALSKFAWKPMVTGLRKREENIRGSLEQAERTRQEAMALQGQLDAKLKAAGGEIAQKMDEARRDAQAVKDQMVAEAKAEIQHERDRLRREIDTAKEQAMFEIRQQSVALAAAMSTKAVRRSMSEDDHRRLLDESLAELKQAGSGFGARTVKGAGL